MDYPELNVHEAVMAIVREGIHVRIERSNGLPSTIQAILTDTDHVLTGMQIGIMISPERAGSMSNHTLQYLIAEGIAKENPDFLDDNELLRRARNQARVNAIRKLNEKATHA